jgi:hypothetical protein
MSDALTPVADGGEKSRSVGFAPETLAEATVGTAASGETASRVRRSPGRVLRHEATLACVAGLLLAVAMIWLVPPFAIWVMSAGETSPVIPDPRRTITGNVGDPTAQAWILAWNGHAVLHDISHVWRTNAFYPEKYPLAFSDSLLGYAPAGMIGSGVADAVLRYNVMLVLAFALASVGGYALARQLGGNRVGAAVAGAAFAYAPWRYGHDGHLNILSTGGIALALAMLARGHGWSLTRGVNLKTVETKRAIRQTKRNDVS